MKPDKKEIETIASIDLEKDVKRKGKRKAEENVKIKLIVPLLEKLGYDTVKDLDFEHRVRTKKADIAIELDGKPRVSIECKDLSEQLDAHLPQAFQYACYKGFLLLVLTNGSEIRVYKTWEAASELEDRLLFSSKLEELPETFFEEKGLWTYMSKPNVMIQSEVIDKWKQSQDRLPMLASYINGLLDDVCIKPDKEKMLREAFQHLGEHRHSAAIESFRKCLTLDIAESEKLALHLEIGSSFYDQGKLTEAHAAFKEGLELARSVQDTYGIAVCVGNIGVVRSDGHDFDNALDDLQQALETYRELGCSQGEAIVLGNMGTIHRHRGDLDNALKHHEAALSIHKERGYRLGEATALSNIGVVCAAKDNLIDALACYQDALEIDKEIGYQQGEASELGNIGLLYSATGETDRAIEYLSEALEIFRIVAPRSVVQTLKNIASVCLKKEDYKKAFEFLARALSVSVSTGQFDEAFEALLVVITAMVADNKWGNLKNIAVMYRSGIITDKGFTNFFTCIHELALFHETGELQHKKAYKNAWQELAPRLRSILAAIIKEEEEEGE